MIVESSTDPAGLETLEMFADAKYFNKWLFDAVKPYSRGRILEIGSGIGNISRLLLKQFQQVSLSDLRPEYCAVLKQQFKADMHLEGVFQIDLSIDDFEGAYPSLIGQFDTLIALNVIEHIKDDQLAINNCRKLLRQNGNLIILVPAFQFLYNSLDKELGHYKRYNMRSISSLLKSVELNMTDTKYFNCAGIPGWWLSGTVFKNRMISDKQLKIFNTLIPLFRLFDLLTSRIIGLSVIGVARKV